MNGNDLALIIKNDPGESKVSDELTTMIIILGRKVNVIEEDKGNDKDNNSEGTTGWNMTNSNISCNMHGIYHLLRLIKQ